MFIYIIIQTFTYIMRLVQMKIILKGRFKNNLYWLDLDGWTDHLVLSFAKRPTNAQRSSGFFINAFQIFYPDTFRHMLAILKGSWVPDKLLKQCSVSWACADYDPSRASSCRGMSLYWHRGRRPADTPNNGLGPPPPPPRGGGPHTRARTPGGGGAKWWN
jgi:hypothetical protein